jgi:S-formylglutathione hydrolase FrmB
VSRRRAPRRTLVVLVAAAALLAAAGALVAVRLIGPDEQGAEVTTLEIDSRAVGRTLPTTVVVPEAVSDVRRPPLLVFLHGRGGDERTELDDAFFSALASVGERAPVVALPYGGDSSYWHDRDSGRWGAYVVRDVIPEVTRRFGTDPRRIAIGGISMGGFGALDVARLNRGRFCVAAGHSPAIWTIAGETAAGAFDDAEDFARHDLVAAAGSPASWAGTRLWIDAGDADPFQPGIQALLANLQEAGTRVTERTPPGGHEGSYWNEHWPDYARFYARALARC